MSRRKGITVKIDFSHLTREEQIEFFGSLAKAENERKEVHQ